MPVHSQAKCAGHARASAICSEDEASTNSYRLNFDASVAYTAGAQRGSGENARAADLSSSREPIQECARVSGEKIVAGREKIDMLEIGRIESGAAHLACKMLWKIQLLRGLLDENPGRMDTRTGL